jgi:hypothetical protein
VRLVSNPCRTILCKKTSKQANEINEIEVNKILFLSSEILERYEMILILFMEVNVREVRFKSAVAKMFMKHGEMTGNLAVLRVIFCAR